MPRFNPDLDEPLARQVDDQVDDGEVGGGAQGKKRKRRAKGPPATAQAYVPLALRDTAASVEVRTKGKAQ